MLILSHGRRKTKHILSVLVNLTWRVLLHFFCDTLTHSTQHLVEFLRSSTVSAAAFGHHLEQYVPVHTSVQTKVAQAVTLMHTMNSQRLKSNPQ